MIPEQVNVCRHCGFPIARADAAWTHFSADRSGLRRLHRRCRLSSHLRCGRADDRLPKTAAATPALDLATQARRPTSAAATARTSGRG